MFVFSKQSSREQKVGKFLITAEDDILRIFKSEGEVQDKADKDTEPVAFFRATDLHRRHLRGAHRRWLPERRGAAAAGGGAPPPGSLADLFLTISVSYGSS